MSLLELINVNKKFQKGPQTITVLDNLELKVDKGELVALVGPSGAGKSTLMHIIGGLERPDSGAVLFNGQNIYDIKEHEINTFRNNSVGFVFQFHYLLDDFTAVENVMLPALVAGMKKEEARSKAMALLEKVGLGDRAEHYRVELSGGEQQRVAISRALINEPEMLLADEPTGNLDKTNSAEVFGILKKLRDEGVCVLMVTHDEKLAEQCDREIKLSKV